MSATKKLLAKFPAVRKTKSGWSARCPAHEDRNASLSIAEGDDGRVLLFCHAGCDHKKIVAALGLDERELFDDDSTQPAPTTRPSTPKADRKSGTVYATAGEAQKAYERMLGKPTRSWAYREPETLDEIGRVLRWDRPDGKKEIRPLSRHADGWRLEHMAEPRPLLGVEFLEDDDRVYVVEGEKCRDVMSLEGGLGLTSTTSSGGSNAASKTDWSPLADREVVILPDNDDAGRKYAADVAAILYKLDPSTTVRVVELDGLDEGGDVADLVEACHGEDELQALRKKIERLADEAEPLKPKASTASATPATPKAASASSPVEAYQPFPVDALPEPLASFVAETADAVGSDPAYVALPLLVAAGAAIGTTRRLELKRGYNAPPILWAAIVGESGTAKSPALRAVLEHVRGRERQLREAYALDRREYDQAIEGFEKERAAWRSDRKATGDPPQRPAEPVGQRALLTDVTVEALAIKLADNPRGLLLARDELAGWLKSMDRYTSRSGGGGSDEAFYLSAYNGEPHTVDRRTGDRREIYVAQAALAITGSIQPAVLRRAIGTERRESGLLARLLLAAPPAQPAKWSEAEVSPLTRQWCHDVLDRLYELAPDVSHEGYEASRLVRLAGGAKAAWIEFHDAHAVELSEHVGDLAAAWSKLRDTAARIALVIHQTKAAAGESVDADSLDADSMRRAIRLVAWLKAETRRVYAILGQTDEETRQRQADDRLEAWIERHGGQATGRDVLTGCYRWLPTSDEVEAAIKRLVDGGRGRWLPIPAGEKGGRPTRLFVLNREAASAQPKPRTAKPSSACADAQAEEVVEI